MAHSVLATDGYKFSMAEAGWPLREETFYYCHRRGGLQVMPLDLEQLLPSLLPEPTEEDYAYLADHEYAMGAGFKAAILRRERLKILSEKTGVFRCRTTFNCTDACPRGIEVTKAIQEVKRSILFDRF